MTQCQHNEHWMTNRYGQALAPFQANIQISNVKSGIDGQFKADDHSNQMDYAYGVKHKEN